ncbi:MAG: NRDE family protein [Bacteroidota bacterium]
MCLIVFSYKQHPTYDLIFAANRDEFYGRPTKAAHFWDEHPHILAGKDLKSGGTWMGITKQGRFSAVTNFRDMSMIKEEAPSRGHLVLDYLANGEDPKVYLEKVDDNARSYDGFNLLAGSIDKLMYYSNYHEERARLTPGLYGLSNHLLNTPWPKVERARHGLRLAMEDEEITEERIFELLKNDDRAPDQDLPDTGLPRELERAVSSVFIDTVSYGTRSSTILLMDKEGHVTFTERRYGTGEEYGVGTSRFEFDTSAS